jgi:hypothetical protein
LVLFSEVAAVRSSGRLLAANEAEDQNDDGDDEDDVDESARNVESEEPEKPEDQKDHEDCPDHLASFIPDGFPAGQDARGRLLATPDAKAGFYRRRAEGVKTSL